MGPNFKKICDVILVTFFGVVVMVISDVITIFLKFDLVIFSFKNHYLTKSRNFRSSILKVKGRWGRKAPSAWRFLRNNISIGGAGPLAHPLATPL